MADEPTKQELVEEAKERGIEGAGSMSKPELIREIVDTPPAKQVGTPIVAEQGKIPEG